jgi:hypothetical protein
MTLGGAASARVRLIVWCRDCRHQIEPDPAEMAERYGCRDGRPGLAQAAGLLGVRQPADRLRRHRRQAMTDIKKTRVGVNENAPDEALALSETEKQTLVAELRRLIRDDRYPLSRRIRTLRGILDKLPPPVREPLPRPKVYAPPRAKPGQRRGRR